MPKAKYLCIENDLKEKISEGIFDEAFPTEEALTERYRCSRVTLRHALADLKYMGYLESRQGSGYKVTSKKQLHSPDSVRSVSDYLMEQGIETKSEVIDFKVVSADKHIAHQLNIVEGEKVFYIERLRYISNQPAIFESKYFSAKKHSYFSYDSLKKSIYKEAEKYGKKIKEVKCSVIPLFPDERVADLLAISKNRPVLKVITQSIYADGEIFSCGEEYYEPDHYQLNFVYKR